MMNAHDKLVGRKRDQRSGEIIGEKGEVTSEV